MRQTCSLVFVIWFIFSGCNSSTDPKPDPLKLAFTPTHVTVYDGSDGAVSLSVSGGTSPYHYLWSNGESTRDISNLTAGVYMVTVSDSENKTKTDSVEITQPNTGTVTDIDGNVYQTVKIGDQWWMAENLKVTHDALGNAVESRYYNGDTDNIDIYGRLYTWDEAMNESTEEGARGIAPEGWHIPSQADWGQLISFLGGASTAGGKMKEAGLDHWMSPNTGASNSSGMTILPAGEKDGIYQFLGRAAIIWSSTQASTTQAKYYTLANDDAAIVLRTWDKNLSYSVRCVKDN